MNYRLKDIVLIALFIGSVSAKIYYECIQEALSCGCGYHDVVINPLYVDGEEAIPFSWSMIVSLRYNCSQNGSSIHHCCSGTIITDSYILTAAHCVNRLQNSSLENVTIAAGIHQLSDERPIIRNVDKIFIHPNYLEMADNLIHDIAIVHLSEPLDLGMNLYLARTCRPPRLERPEDAMDYPSNGTTLIVTGWDHFSDGNDVLDELQQVTIYSIHHNQSTCANTIHNNLMQFCAGIYDSSNNDSNNGEHFCLFRNCLSFTIYLALRYILGDSGAPIFRWIGNRWEQMGLVSYAKGSCGSPDYQTVFTRLASYNNWIDLIVFDNNTRPTVTYRCDKYSSCGCGYNDVEFTSSRIVGGEEAVPYSWSMMVSIRDRFTNNHFCGGSILSDSYILTAAHCVDDKPSTRIQIAAGIHNKYYSYPVIREVDQIYIHPGWSSLSSEHRNDIAILHLAQPFDFTINLLIKQTCVPNVTLPTHVQDYPPNGTRLVAIGWGNINSSLYDNSSNNLHQVQIFLIDNTDPICNKSILDIETQFCAALYEDGKGDDGGPILQWLGNRWEQVGITSYSEGCSLAGKPSIYTRLAAYREWILSILTNVEPTNQTTMHITTISITSQPTTSNSTRLVNTTIASQSPIVSSSTPESIQSMTYMCDRIPGQCGCSLTNVVVSFHSQLSTDNIVHSHNALPYSWSMVVSVRIRGEKHSCSGTILSDSFILTAARCVSLLWNPVNITVAVGIYVLSQPSIIVREVDGIYIHPNYVNEHLHNIAILHLKHSLELSAQSLLGKSCIPIVESPFNQYPPTDSSLLVVGWRSSRGESHLFDFLQQIPMRTINNQHPSCSISNDNYQFCAELLNDRDSCLGK
ncbi:unnamed protein product [Rotaria sp. Silwood1]|nr:unnamed protein product [Rotaria sp. Silwood1]